MENFYCYKAFSKLYYWNRNLKKAKIISSVDHLHRIFDVIFFLSWIMFKQEFTLSSSARGKS